MLNSQRNEGDEIKIYTVPFTIKDIKSNIYIEQDSSNKFSKEKIIAQAYIHHTKGNFSEAAKYYQHLIDQGYNDHDAFSNYGIILKDNREYKKAEKITRQAIQLKPDFPEAYCNLGSIFIGLGKLEEAKEFTLKAIKLKPDFAEAYTNLGIILKNNGNLKKAEIYVRKAIQINPNLAYTFANLGMILAERRNLKDAEISFRKALKLNPDYAEAHYNLANVMGELGDLIESRKHFEKAIKLNNNHSNAKLGLIECNANMSDWSDNERQRIWLDNLGIDEYIFKIITLMYAEDDISKQLKRSNNLYKEKYSRPSESISTYPKDKIHIGYFSADFRDHPVMHLIASLFELHDKSKFKVYLYSFTPYEDTYTERAKNSGCIFRNIKDSSEIQSVELARNDQLDIAIDLMGYSKFNRMSIFSHRVAPIQLSYLGYAGTSGSDVIDYIIADKISIPTKYEKFYSEKILRMPNCFLCNDHKKDVNDESLSRKSFNLPDQAFVFTCFNPNKKITSKEYDIWMRLLKNINGSVLWLRKPNTWAMQNLYKETEERNVDPKRIIFANKVPLDQHFARHKLADLGLDTFNYNGFTTTTDALWAGLPVLTKIGESFSARGTASLLTIMGLNELITFNENEYEETAYKLAQNRNQLSKIKDKLSQGKVSSPLFNSKLFTKDLEKQYIKLVKEHTRKSKIMTSIVEG